MAGLIYHPQAEDKTREAAAWYEQGRVGLGHDFLAAVESSTTQITEYPLAWRKIRGRFRRALVRDFPYAIIYAVENDTIYIVAVMHTKRKPGYWVSRVRK